MNAANPFQSLFSLYTSSPSTQKPSIIFVIQMLLYSLINCLFLGMLTFSLNLYLPVQVIQLFGDEYKSIALGLISAMTAISSTVMTPLAGFIVDRFKLPRAPFIILSVIIFCACTLLRAIIFPNVTWNDYKQNFWFWIFTVMAITTLITASKIFFAIITPLYAAIMLDQFPQHSFAIVSATMSLFSIIGSLYGSVVPGFLINKVNIVWIILFYCVVSIIACICLLFAFPEYKKYVSRQEKSETNQTQNASTKQTLFAFFTPFASWNFRMLFFARFFVSLGSALIGAFYLYFLRDLIGHSKNRFNLLLFPNLTITTAEEASSVVGIGMIVSTAVGVITSPLFIQALGAAKTVSIALVLTIFANTVSLILLDFNWCLLTQCISAFCVGSIIPLDNVLINQNLPNKKELVKDLGIMSIAIFIPQILAGPIGGVALQLGNSLATYLNLVYPFRYLGYYVLFFVVFSIQLSAAIIILFLKSKKKRRLKILEKTEEVSSNETSIQFSTDISLQDVQRGIEKEGGIIKDEQDTENASPTHDDLALLDVNESLDT